MKRLLYFHGFASSPHGRKVDELRAKLEPEGFEIVAPDLNVPSFRQLDFDAMVDHAYEVASVAPDVIIGSSLGALVALGVANERPGIPLVLIAPAFAMGNRWVSKLPENEDPITVFNYAVNDEVPIHRRFFEQMGEVSIDDAPPPSRVTLIMGRSDESVPFELVEGRWLEWHASGRLVYGSRMFEIPDGDHRLIEHADLIAEAIREAAAG